ncbi:DUF7221 family queuine tRNA-ribosyltransferase-like protein [Nannocystis pusilla]|uniref:deazapurine DNA modification protein DpdA family protein n=1 Tax=Nannocystis pusilla TaxID=889268 RepID=UPI003B7CE53D
MYQEDTWPFPAVWLGAHEPWWAWEGHAHGRLLLSANRLRARASSTGRGRLRPADVPVFLDSGAFMWLKQHGTWATWPASDFAAFVVHVAKKLGGLDHVGIQDWVCESYVLARTGLSIEEHQRRTVASYLQLRRLAPKIPWVPTLQGHTAEEYLRCAQMYRDARVSLEDARLVGLGSVCRRKSTREIASTLAGIRAGLGTRVRLHGFGVKSDAAVFACWQLASIDSMAWSSRARGLEASLRLALGMPVSASSAEVMGVSPRQLDRLDLDNLEFWEWKRAECPTSAVNSQIFAEHWRGRQIEALAVAILHRARSRRAAQELLEALRPAWLAALRPDRSDRLARLLERERRARGSWTSSRTFWPAAREPAHDSRRATRPNPPRVARHALAAPPGPRLAADAAPRTRQRMLQVVGDFLDIRRWTSDLTYLQGQLLHARMFGRRSPWVTKMRSHYRRLTGRAPEDGRLHAKGPFLARWPTGHDTVYLEGPFKPGAHGVLLSRFGFRAAATFISSVRTTTVARGRRPCAWSTASLRASSFRTRRGAAARVGCACLASTRFAGGWPGSTASELAAMTRPSLVTSWSLGGRSPEATGLSGVGGHRPPRQRAPHRCTPTRRGRPGSTRRSRRPHRVRAHAAE